MKTILITAYAVNPYKGSEDGTGWNISKELAKSYKVIVITRENNQPEIDRYFASHDDAYLANMEFRYHDLSGWAMRLKKKLGERGYVLYFYFWQMFLPLFVRRNKLQFDLSYVLNFHSDSTPQFMWLLGKPVVWGPVGHHPKMPSQYLKKHTLGVKLTDILYGTVKWSLRNLDPFFYIAKKSARQIIAINSSVQKVMRVPDRKITIIPAVGSEPVNHDVVNRDPNKFNVLCVGRFTAMKGFDIAIAAFHEFYKNLSPEKQKNTQLTLVGKGECLDELREQVQRLNLTEVVNIVLWVPKEEMHQIYVTSNVFLFPSHEGAGMVVVEAMSYGLPVVCFDNVGPGELAGSSGIKVPYTTYQNSVKQFAEHLTQLHNDIGYRKQKGKEGIARFNTIFTWQAKNQQIKQIMETNLAQKAIAVFHPSAELYGADRILVNALAALPEDVHKRVYLFRHGPLVDFMKQHVKNVSFVIKPDMPVMYRKIFNVKGLIWFKLSLIKFLFFMRSEHKKFHFTSGYVNTLSVGFILPILKVLGIKRYVHVHEIIDSPKMVGKLTAWLANSFANNIVCVSQAVYNGLERYQKDIGQKAQVIHNGIAPIVVSEKPVSEELSFYLFGRIKPEKGQWFLIESLAKVPKEILGNHKFILVGGAVPGQEKQLEELVQKIETLGLTQNVDIQGFTPNIADAMNKADVCLVPSIMSDPFPTTVLEAMSASKTVITTNNGGAKEAVVDQETGFLIHPNNTSEFANVLTQVIEEKEHLPEWGKAAKKRFSHLFTTQNFNKNWLEFNQSNQLI